ncbi:hypothetical protein V1264_024952 [Littorina saxatilis]|uniref:Scavenger receptor cysteine-rich domain-containing protein DMBT1 n=2 Tax=Littorina saxatilis TaxID=31220 RepID=A0AAN9AN74_9CAEN
MAVDNRKTHLLCFLYSVLWTLTVLKGQLAKAAGPTQASITVSIQAGDSAVKVFHDGAWSKICATDWDSKDAQVVCRMLGYWHGQGTAVLGQANLGDVILVDNMDCHGNETSLAQCNFNGFKPTVCSVPAVGAVRCDAASEVHVRLADGYAPWEGRLEVQNGGVWRPVCHQDFDDFDAQVVCRMLGLRSKGGKAHTEQKFALSNLPPLIYRLDCTGAETEITQCKGKDYNQGEQCTNAGVECYSCGALYTGERGEVQSENFPLSYPRYSDCLYVIRPANEKQLYKLEFGNFSTEQCCDTLEASVLKDASNMPGGTKYSGKAAPPLLLGKAFALHFVTDGSNSMQGFHAKWSPALVEDVVSVTCEAGQFTVDIDLNFLKRLYPLSSEATIALADPSCVGTIRSTNGEDHLIISSKTNSCGTKIVSSGKVTQYNNFLVDRVFAQGNTMIVRDRRWEIPFQCTVGSSDDFQVHYNPVPDRGRRAAILPEVVPEVTSAHVRQRREVRGSVSVDLTFPVTFTPYQDRAFNLVASIPLSRRLGDDIDLRLEMTGGDLDLKMVLQNCYTKPNIVTNTTYYIIQDGCSKDSSTEILSLKQHVTDFRFTAFEFAGDFPLVYVTCDVRICSANENTPKCTQSCIAPAPLAEKRSVNEPIINRKSESKLGLYKISFGPITLRK